MTALPHTSPGARPGPFIATREHRRFTEFATAVRRHGYIGLCYGPAGVGKTLSARRYARWDTAEPYLLEWGPRQASDAAIKAMLNRSRAVLYTPTILTSPRQLDDDLRLLMHRVQLSIYEYLHPKPGAVPRYRGIAPYVELVIIDEAERLRPHVLEHLRARFDVERMGLILIGMPGIEKRLARYPQLYSRVGFAHHYRPLSHEELLFVLTRHWRRLGQELDSTDFTDAQAIATVARITDGNFRLIQRLFAQIERVLKINDLATITADVVEAARSTLVIGAT
jgi:DNA transposition AAA+ family ATPase